MEDIDKMAQVMLGKVCRDEGAARLYGGEGELDLWFMDRSMCVDSQEACSKDPGCYDFFSRIGS